MRLAVQSFCFANHAPRRLADLEGTGETGPRPAYRQSRLNQDSSKTQLRLKQDLAAEWA